MDWGIVRARSRTLHGAHKPPVAVQTPATDPGSCRPRGMPTPIAKVSPPGTVPILQGDAGVNSASVHARANGGVHVAHAPLLSPKTWTPKVPPTCRTVPLPGWSPWSPPVAGWRRRGRRTQTASARSRRYRTCPSASQAHAAGRNRFIICADGIIGALAVALGQSLTVGASRTVDLGCPRPRRGPCSLARATRRGPPAPGADGVSATAVRRRP